MINFLRLFLLPVSGVFYLLVGIRNFCYDKKIFNSHKMPVPVISVGNITTGGTGKTPLVIYITEYFLDKDIRVGIVSRGYGRRSEDLKMVFANGEIVSTPAESGDELFMIASKFKKSQSRDNVFVCAGKDRMEAVIHLFDNYNIEVAILDDAFQHRRIYRDIDIVLLNGAKIFQDKILLPAGNLRETISRVLINALLIFNTKSDDVLDIPDNLSGRNLIVMSYEIKNIVNTFGKQYTGTRCAVICGIGNPESFIKSINKQDIETEECYIFKDHYKYQLNQIEKIAREYGGDFITTEKDIVKIKSLGLEKQIMDRIYFSELGLTFRENYFILENELNKLIKDKFAENN